jgi:hypothetical protein
VYTSPAMNNAETQKAISELIELILDVAINRPNDFIRAFVRLLVYLRRIIKFCSLDQCTPKNAHRTCTSTTIGTGNTSAI